MKMLIPALSTMIPPIVVLTFPAASLVGPLLVIMGFLLVILTGLVRTFRESKIGIFRQWTEPGKFLATKFSSTDSVFFIWGGCIAVGGFFSILALYFLRGV